MAFTTTFFLLYSISDKQGWKKAAHALQILMKKKDMAKADIMDFFNRSFEFVECWQFESTSRIMLNSIYFQPDKNLCEQNHRALKNRKMVQWQIRVRVVAVGAITLPTSNDKIKGFLTFFCSLHFSITFEIFFKPLMFLKVLLHSFGF